MATAGDVIEHPVTKERITFLLTAEATGGALVRLEQTVVPGGVGGHLHVHPRQEEAFEVRSGTLTLVANGTLRRLGPGEGAVVPAGEAHCWRLDGGEAARVVVEFRPALRTEEFFESFFGLAQDGKVDPRTGLPEQPWLALLVHHYHDDVVHPAEPPLSRQLALAEPFVAAAERRGDRLPYPYPYTERTPASLP